MATSKKAGAIARKQRTSKKHFAIDVHSHIDVPEAKAMIDRLPAPPGGRPSFGIRERPEEQAKIDALQKPLRNDPMARSIAIDKLGFDMQGVSFNLPGSVYRAPANEALAIAKTANDGVADFVARMPNRYYGYCSVPLQDANLAAAELERAVTQLGLKGLWTLSNVAGRDLGDADLGPLWAKAEALGVPIFIHPIGFTSPERMQKAMLWNSIGQPLEEALAMCSLIYGGVLDAYPKLKLAICHGGGYLPYYIGRMYETKMERAKQEKTDLEKKESPTDEERAKIETLAAQIADYRQKALARYLATLENVDTDEAFLNRILALDPSSATAIYLYGKLLLERGDLIGADVRFKEAISKDPKNVAAYIASGDVAMRNGNLAQAIEQYKAAMALRPEDVTILTKLVSAALSLGDLDEADRLLSQIQKIDPENAKLKASQGDLAYQRMRAAQTERDALRAKTTRTVDDDKRLADLTNTIEGLYGIAIGRYEEALARSGSVDVLIALGRAHLAFGELAKAQRQFEDAIRRSPYSADAYDGLAETLLAQGEKDRAIENYRTAFSRASADPQRQRLGEKLVELVPGDLDLKLKLAKVYAAQYMWSAAIRQYAAVLTARPDSLESYLGIAEAYKWRAEYDTALSYLAKGLTSVTTDAAKVSVYEKVVDVVQAQVGQGKPLSKAGLDALFDLAKLDLASGKSSQAKTRLDRIAKDDPTYRPTEVADLLKQAAGTGTSVTPLTP